jgi:hypothetical protein
MIETNASHLSPHSFIYTDLTTGDVGARLLKAAYLKPERRCQSTLFSADRWPPAPDEELNSFQST